MSIAVEVRCGECSASLYIQNASPKETGCNGTRRDTNRGNVDAIAFSPYHGII